MEDPRAPRSTGRDQGGGSGWPLPGSGRPWRQFDLSTGGIMANETSKLKKWRDENGHFEKYLKGDGIDIGCGGDKLKVPSGTVRGWDWGSGDAQFIKGVADETFDFVYS